MAEKIDVEKLAHLARIELSDEQKRQMEKDLPAILDFVGQLEEVGVPSAEAGTSSFAKASEGTQLLGLENVFRADTERKGDLPKGQELTKEAPKTCDTLIEVPEVFSEDGDPESFDGAGK